MADSNFIDYIKFFQFYHFHRGKDGLPQTDSMP